MLLSRCSGGMMIGGKLFIAAVLMTQAVAAGREVGVVKEVNLSSREIVVSLDGGGERRIVLAPEKPILHITPGQKDLATAEELRLEDVAAGDRVLLRRDADGIVIVSRKDLVSRREAQRAEWRSNGLVGIVHSVDPETHEITLKASSLRPSGTVRLYVPPKAKQLRYRAGSARFNETQPSQLRDIEPGDQVHALLDSRPADDMLIADTIVSGYFHNFAALVTAVDLTAGIITVRDVEHNTSVAVRVVPDTALRSITPEAAARWNTRGRQATPADTAEGEEPTDVRSILERLPVFELNSLQKGDALIVATAERGNQVSALTVLSGAERLLAESAASEALGEWDLSLEPREE